MFITGLMYLTERFNWLKLLQQLRLVAYSKGNTQKVLVNGEPQAIKFENG
jgi:hypothetical protein